MQFGGAKWLILQAPQQLAVQVRHAPTMRTFQEHSRERRTGEAVVEQSGGRKGSRVARPWHHLVLGNMEELSARGQDAEWGSGEGTGRGTWSADRG